MQPWKLRVIGPQARARLESALLAALDDPGFVQSEEYRYYPETFREPYLSRRRKVGWDLYGLLGVAKGDVAGMKRQSAANLRFFDAPVALMLTVDRDLEIGSWIDLGMFLQSLLIAAQGHGLQSCPQAIFARFPPCRAARTRHPRERDRGLRHRHRPCRSGGAPEWPRRGARAGRGLHHLAGLRIRRRARA